MLIGRPTALALLVGFAALSTVACSQSGSDGDSNAAADTATVVDASSLITVSAQLPYEVKQLHSASGPVLGAHWGQHGGPEVTTPDSLDTTKPPTVTRWFIPNSLTAEAGQQPLKSVLAPNLPSTLFWSADGFTDLSFGETFTSYSGSGDNFPGEVLLFSKNYDSVISRASVNGFYSGVGVTSGTTQRLVYSGLSGLTAAPAPEVKDSGLWVSDISATSLIGANPSVKLVAWTGASGPVAADNDGNVFTAAFVSGGAHKDEIYGVTKTQALGNEPVPALEIAHADLGGTQSLAAVSVPGSGRGIVLAKGYDGSTGLGLYAQSYTSSGALAVDGATITDAIKPAGSGNNISAFSDPKGNLWIALEGDAGAWLIELEPKAP